MRKLIPLASILLITQAHAQVMESPNKEVTRSTLPEEPQLTNDTEYKRKFSEINLELEKLKREAEEAKTRLRPGVAPSLPEGQGQSGSEDTELSSLTPDSAASKTETSKGFGLPSRRKIGQVRIDNSLSHMVKDGFGSELSHLATPAQTFATSILADDVFAVLPTGSHVKARVVSGVEANAQEPYPVLLQLDYAFTGPNRSKVDLSSCFMIAKARANLSTERVMMETESLSCVRENGEHFKTQAKGFIAGDDSTFGATGTYISKQGQVLLAAVLANIAKNAGEAVASAQQVTTVAGADKAAAATNVTGSKAAFIAGKSVVDAGALIAQWYLDQARQLVPSIGVGSGQDVFVVMLDSVKVPSLKLKDNSNDN